MRTRSDGGPMFTAAQKTHPNSKAFKVFGCMMFSGKINVIIQMIKLSFSQMKTLNFIIQANDNTKC
jgi:ATP sulfurylase